MTVTADIWMPGEEDPSYELRFADWEIAQAYIGQYLEIGALVVVSIVDEPLLPEGLRKPIERAIH